MSALADRASGLVEVARRLQSLMVDPQPGLLGWNEALARVAEDAKQALADLEGARITFEATPSRTDGGPAFPVFMLVGGASQDDIAQLLRACRPVGVSVRDYFAASSLQAHRALAIDADPAKVARWAYDDADAMLAARSTGGAS